MAEERIDCEDGTARRLIAPAVRERAAELGIPVAMLQKLAGTGPRGRLCVDDLEELRKDAGLTAPRPVQGRLPLRPPRTISGSAPTPTAITVQLDDRGRARAKRAMDDATAAADLTSVIEVDLTDLITGIGAETGLRPDVMGFAEELLNHVARGVIELLHRHRTMNARIDLETDGGCVVLREHVDLAVLISGPGGDARDVVRDADLLSSHELRRRLSAIGLLANARRDGDPMASATTGGNSEATFTIFDRRMGSLLFETPPLPRDCSGALAVGKVERRPVSDSANGGFRIAWAAYLCLTYDHRLIDGADAARFLGDLADALSRSDRAPDRPQPSL